MIKIKASHKYLLSVFLVSLIIFVPALFAVFRNNQKSSNSNMPAQEIKKEPPPARTEENAASKRHIGAWVTYMDLNISDSGSTESTRSAKRAFM